MINGLPCNQNIGFGTGLASTNAMAVEGIKSTDNLLAVISWDPATGIFLGQDVTDFTVADGEITAATIELDGDTFVAIWTDAPAA